MTPERSSGRELEFYFDFLSPYAYLAWTQIDAVGRAHDIPVRAIPVVFAGLLQAHGTRGPAEVPAKRHYLVRDIVRIADHLGVPIAPPFALPFRSLHALRLATVPMPTQLQHGVVTELFRAAWAQGQDVGQPAVANGIAERAGMSAEQVAGAELSSTKEQLRANTSLATELGVFGVPTVHTEGELFWGVDSLPYLKARLGGARPAGPGLLAAFDRVPVGVTRSPAQ